MKTATKKEIEDFIALTQATKHGQIFSKRGIAFVVVVAPESSHLPAFSMQSGKDAYIKMRLTNQKDMASPCLQYQRIMMINAFHLPDPALPSGKCCLATAFLNAINMCDSSYCPDDVVYDVEAARILGYEKEFMELVLEINESLLQLPDGIDAGDSSSKESVIQRNLRIINELKRFEETA